MDHGSTAFSGRGRPGIGSKKDITRLKTSGFRASFINQWTDSMQHGDYAFQVSTPNGWEVCICDGEMIKEYKNLMDDQMSALAITSEVFPPTQSIEMIQYLIHRQTFQSRFTLPGGDWNAIHDLPPQPALARSLMWLKSRAANENDPYFMELAATFRKAFDTEISVPSPGISKALLAV